MMVRRLRRDPGDRGGGPQDRPIFLKYARPFGLAPGADLFSGARPAWMRSAWIAGRSASVSLSIAVGARDLVPRDASQRPPGHAADAALDEAHRTVADERV